MNETEKRREIQKRFLREGYSQEKARQMAAELSAEKLDDWLERLSGSVRFPERQILPPGAIDLTDMKHQREEELAAIEEAKYYANRDNLVILMMQSFCVSELPLAAIQALLDALEEGGENRLAAMDNIIQIVETLRSMAQEIEQQERGR